MEFKILDNQGKLSKKTLTASDATFAIDFNEALIHKLVVSYMSNARAGTRAQKTRSEVKHSTRKPFRQKGTGNARQGTSRSPLNRGGGVIFGPSPAYYFKKVNAKTKKLAFKCILSEKVKNDALKVIDSIELETNKTKDFVSFLGSNNLNGNKMTIVVSQVDQNLELCNHK